MTGRKLHMKLVNIVKREREKKDLEILIKKLDPILLTKQGAEAMEQLIETGLITRQEKVFFDIKTQTKLICLIVEKELEELGYECFTTIGFIDKKVKKPGIYGEYVHISGPNVPEEYIQALDGLMILPFLDPLGISISTNKVSECYDVESLPINDECLDILIKYNVQTIISFPLHVEGEVMGVFGLFSCENLKEDKIVKEFVQKRIYELEGTLASLQERWKNRNVESWHTICSADGRIHYVEEGIKNVLGFNPTDMIGRANPSDLVHIRDKEQFINKLRKSVQNREITRTVCQLKSAQGKWVTIELLVIPVTSGKEFRYIEIISSTGTELCQEYENQLNRKIK